jgi:hypothetical protein
LLDALLRHGELRALLVFDGHRQRAPRAAPGVGIAAAIQVGLGEGVGFLWRRLGLGIDQRHFERWLGGKIGEVRQLEAHAENDEGVEEDGHRRRDLHAPVLAERGHAAVERIHSALELGDARFQPVYGGSPRRMARVLRPPPERHDFPVG